MRRGRKITDIVNVSSRIKMIVALIFAAAFLPACSKPAQDAEVTTPAPEVILPTRLHATTAASVTPASASSTPAPDSLPSRPSPVPETPEERPPSPAQLQAAYLAAKETPDRIEIVYQLASADSADAMNVLMRLFQSEADAQLKQEMLDAADRIDGQLPVMLTFLSLALGPSQPTDVRDSAFAMLLGINDRRAIPAWQPLLTDPDPDTRELARQQIEDLQQLPPD